MRYCIYKVIGNNPRRLSTWTMDCGYEKYLVVIVLKRGHVVVMKEFIVHIVACLPTPTEFLDPALFGNEAVV